MADSGIGGPDTWPSPRGGTRYTNEAASRAPQPPAGITWNKDAPFSLSAPDPLRLVSVPDHKTHGK